MNEAYMAMPQDGLNHACTLSKPAILNNEDGVSCLLFLFFVAYNCICCVWLSCFLSLLDRRTSNRIKMGRTMGPQPIKSGLLLLALWVSCGVCIQTHVWWHFCSAWLRVVVYCLLFLLLCVCVDVCVNVCVDVCLSLCTCWQYLESVVFLWTMTVGCYASACGGCMCLCACTGGCF